MSKRVCCTHCQGTIEIASRAMSVFCPLCNKRLVVEDIRVQRYYAVRELATCGDVLVSARGHLVAAVKAGNLTVNGRLQGNVAVGGCVRLGKQAAVLGDIRAPRIRVEDGATLRGFVRIEGGAAEPVPGTEPEPPADPQRPAAPRSSRSSRSQRDAQTPSTRARKRVSEP